jgi:hypothetical protein
MYRINRRLRSIDASQYGVNSGILFILFLFANSLEILKTAIVGQFVWGAAPLKKYQGRPKINSDCIEISRRA